MKKSNMRSQSENLQGRVIKSYWCKDIVHDFKLSINLRVRKVIKPDGKIIYKKDTTILIKEAPKSEIKILCTDFGPVCVNCKTSDYLHTDRSGEWYDSKITGYTCTRCNSATLKV